MTSRPTKRPRVSRSSLWRDVEVDPVIYFMRLMWEVDHELQRVSKRMVATVGLTGPQRLALVLISRYPGISAGELAQWLHLDPGTLTGIIARLELAKLIKRTRDQNDGRRAMLTLTAKGRAANRRRAGTVESAVRRTLDETRTADADATRRMLSRLAAALRRALPPE